MKISTNVSRKIWPSNHNCTHLSIPPHPIASHLVFDVFINIHNESNAYLKKEEEKIQIKIQFQLLWCYTNQAGKFSQDIFNWQRIFFFAKITFPQLS